CSSFLFFFLVLHPPTSTLFPYTTLFRSSLLSGMLGLVDRQLQVVRADPITLRIGIRKGSAHQHLVIGEVETVHQHTSAHGNLLILIEEVTDIPVQCHHAHVPKGE